MIDTRYIRDLRSNGGVASTYKLKTFLLWQNVPERHSKGLTTFFFLGLIFVQIPPSAGFVSIFPAPLDPFVRNQMNWPCVTD